MAASAVAAAGTAAALYYIGRRGGVCGDVRDAPRETHANVHFAPTSFLEDLYFLAEGLRYTYGETLGRWRTADLLIGLAYLCRKDPEEHPVADIAQLGHPFGQGVAPEDWPAALIELRELERYFRYCSGLRERRPLQQRHYFRRVLDVTDEDLLAQELRAGVLKPSYVLVRDRQLRTIVLAIRGTHSFKDMFTSLTGASKPHHLVDANGVVLGYSHFGMLAAARWIKSQTRGLMEAALQDNPGYRLQIIGHSLGGGTAALLTMMLREAGGPFADVTCVAVACPSCMTLELAQSCSDYVTTVIHNADVIPTICPGSADALREMVMRSSWFREFRADVRASGIVRAVEVGIRGVGSATLTATSWTTSKLTACVPRRRPAGSAAAAASSVRQRRPQHKRRNSDEATLAAGAEGGGDGGGSGSEGDGDSLPLSASAPAGGSFALLAAAAEAEARQAGGGASTSGEGRQAAARQEWGGWGQAVTRGTTSAFRSWSSGLLRRMWSGASVDAAGMEDGSSDAIGGEAGAAGGGGAGAGGPGPSLRFAAFGGGGAADAAPGPMDIDSEEQRLEREEEEELQAMEEEAAAAAGGGGGPHQFSLAGCFQRRERQREDDDERESSGNLEEEVNSRMDEVRRAVHDAEAEEAALGGGDDTVPAVIRPGSYGTNGVISPSRLSPSKQNPRWKRQMYPAGRILHLVPARLVPGTRAHEAAAAAAAAAAAEPGAPAGPAGDGSSSGEHEPAAALPPGPSHASKLSVSDLIAGEGLLNSKHYAGSARGTADFAAGGGGGGIAAEQQQQQQLGEQGAQGQVVGQGQPHEEMMLLEGVPQEAYARIKLCRSVLSDHIIPNYLRSLESALVGLRLQAGAAAVAAAAAAGDEPQTLQPLQPPPAVQSGDSPLVPTWRRGAAARGASSKKD
ncbi:lipase class 3 family isoform B [Micractinium conductrix]|uniref:Lipase class 3 family isoform B n=1 Tax=Micractinium conductrix TaxID=554055 RepID=A0A2P6VJD1_9CHLO|nr:lipase class 3 family isoform B [Micractinium conductrix]|eukprot:PSC74205.1 lipase class 3 family isoform B [Micractinium conductrix]